MQLFRAQLSRYIPHPHRDSWMRNNLDEWLQLLRIGSFLTLIAAAWNITRVYSPLGIPDQFLPILEQTTGEIFNESNNSKFSLSELQHYIKYSIAVFFTIAALASLGCGKSIKLKYIIPVFIAGSLMALATVKHSIDNDFKLISIISFLLPVSTPFLLLGYRRLANKVDHWNYYASFFCVITVFGNAITFLFYPEKPPHFQESAFTSLALPSAFAETAITSFSYITIFFALLISLPTTRRLGLFALIIIGALTCIYRTIALSFDSTSTTPADLIITDLVIHSSYWLIPLLILMSLASRRKTQTLKL